MKYYALSDKTGVITGSGKTPDNTIPNDAVECTADQAANIQQYAVNPASTPPSIVSAPATQQLLITQTTCNAAIKMQIDILEKGQARAVREAAIGVAGAVDRLKVIDAKIAALRLQFVK